MHGKSRAAILVAVLGTGTPAHAATISGSAIFEVLDSELNVIATGNWLLERNRVLDFEFTTEQGMWDEIDIGQRCECQAFFPDFLDSANFHFDDTVGNAWHLFFSFRDGNFGILYDVDGVTFGGTSENGEFFAPGDYDVFVDVPESGTLALITLGLLGLARVRLGAEARPPSALHAA